MPFRRISYLLLQCDALDLGVGGVLFQVFEPRVDNSALVWLTNFKDPNGHLARWSLKLQQFDFEVIPLNVLADVLSKAVVESVEIV